MKKVSYATIAASEKDFDHLLLKVGLQVNPNDRIHQGYKIVRELENVYRDKEKYRIFRDKHGIEILKFSLFDTRIIYDVIPSLQDIDSDILVLKLKRLLNGTLSHKETTSNSDSRNTLFELLMLSYLKNGGVDASLCEPNPDILAKIGKQTYHIQCKRVFNNTDSSIRNTLKSAVSQLLIDLKDKPEGHFGLIALSVEPMFTKGGKMLLAQSEKEAFLTLGVSLKDMCGNYGRLWQDPSLIKDRRIIAIFLHTIALTETMDESILSVGTYLIINNTWSEPDSNFYKLGEDFSRSVRTADFSSKSDV